MEFLIVDMVDTIPQISAKDYFKVNKRLFPQVNLLIFIERNASLNFLTHFVLSGQVIGTTLTYFFILHQFKASEKKLDPEDDESY